MPDSNNQNSQPLSNPTDSLNPEVAADVPEDEFKHRLASLREAKGLRHDTLSELSKHVDPQKRGIARTTLRAYELGVSKPGIRELRILSQALGVSTNRLIFGKDDIGTLAPSGDIAVERPTVMGKSPEEIVALTRFLVAMYKLGNQERDAVFRVAASLASSKLGEVEYRKLMDLTQELVETYLDVQADNLAKGQFLTPENATAMLEAAAPLFDATFSKFGIQFAQQKMKVAEQIPTNLK